MSIHFEEKQYFRQWWLWLILLGSCVPVIAAILFIPDDEPVYFKVIPLILCCITLVLMFLMRLETKIYREGISYKMWPFHLNEHLVQFDDIEDIYVRNYQAIIEYGGWGIKGSIKNKAYNVSGNEGIQIVLKNGKKILLGTQKAQEWEIEIEKWRKQKTS